jgi:hypothetical protein
VTEPDLSEIAAFEESDELRKALASTQSKLRRAETKTADLIAAVERGAREAMVALGNPPAVPKPTPDKRSKHPEVAFLLCSDWHIGKQTSSFNSTIASERLDVLASKVEKITLIERADHPVRKIRAMLDGDFCENTGIFPGQAFEVDSTTFEQVFAAVGATERLLRRLLAIFEIVEVDEQNGNHGRVGKKGDYAVTDNLDRLIYRMARERLAEHEKSGRLVWHEATDWYSILAEGAYRAMLIHGHQIKSFGGNTPAFGILRKANAWASGVIEPFTDLYMGHFHQALALPMANGRGRVFVNPSIESDSVYAKEFVAATGTPGQRLNFVDPAKGRITSERILWLDAHA